jgi:hypothetical protein
MTTLQTEKIYEDGEWRDTQALALPNGAKLLFLRWHRGMIMTFRYCDENVTFDVSACRWGYENPRDYWEVLLEFALDRFQSANGHKLTTDRIKQITQNIENLLLAWPPAKAEIPIREVKFVMRVG